MRRMVSIKFGLLLGGEPPFATATECVRLGPIAEKDGYDAVWLPDHLVDIDGSLVDPWVTLGYLAATTKKVDLYTAVTDYQKIHPAKLAQIIATLDELSNGRITLGIGAGEAMNNVPFGVPWDEPSLRVKKLEEYIQVLRLLWSSRSDHRVSFSGKYFALRDAWIDQRPFQEPYPRVFIGALGSRAMLDLTGRIGDGWFPWFMTPNMYKQKIERVIDVAKSAGRDPETIERTYAVMVVVASDPRVVEDSINSIKPLIATVCPFLCEEEGMRLPSGIETNYQRILLSKEELNELTMLGQLVPTSLVKKVCAIGNVDEVISFLQERIRVGARHFVIVATRGQAEENLRAFRDEIIPYFREHERT